MFYFKRWVCGFSPAKWFRPSPFDRVPCSKSCQKPKAFISNVKVSKIIKANRYHGNSKVWANLYVSLWPACISDMRHHFSAGQNFTFHLSFWPLSLRANLICPNTHIFCSLHKFHTSHFRYTLIHNFQSIPHKTLQITIYFCLARPILRRLWLSRKDIWDVYSFEVIFESSVLLVWTAISIKRGRKIQLEHFSDWPKIGRV